MGDRSQLISRYTEVSTSDPQRIRPTDRQMGLGTHNFFQKKAREKKQGTENT
jgi:hypothetical protein